MELKDVKGAEEAHALISARRPAYVKVGVFDADGVMRGKYMSRNKFLSALEKGFGFCDVVLGWDCQDQLYDNVTYTGWHTGYPDAPVRILPESVRELPFEDNTLFFLGEFAQAAEAVCPRGVLRRVLDRARQMGFVPQAGFEYEFFVFEEDAHSIRAKRYRDLRPMAPGYFGYSVLRNSVHSDFYRELLHTCETMDFTLEGLHEETGPGVLEAAIEVDHGLAAADKAALFKTFTKIVAQRCGFLATFMAKWSPDWPGQSGHIHISLRNVEGHAVFHDPAVPHGMSDVMRHFVAGQQRLMPELLAMIAPTVNSFSRLIPGFWAPTEASWGLDNRTCALRAIPGSPKSQRVEFRIAAADANPYVVLAAALASGLWGIANKTALKEPVQGNAYEANVAAQRELPATLFEAAARLRHSEAAHELFGTAFVDHYAATRQWEEREYRKEISDWEMKRYFEII